MQEINMIGQMNNSDGTFESANRVYGTDGISPTIPTCSGGGIQPKIMEIEIVEELNPMNDNTCRTIKNQYYKNSVPNFESHGTFGASGVVQIKQATKDEYIKCEIGGGGRSELSGQQNTQRKGARERSDMPNTNNGEYP